MRVLVITAVGAERDAALRQLPGAHPVAGLPYDTVRAGEVIVAAGGVGPVAVAVATSRLLSALARTGQAVELVVSAGIAGGFRGRADVGDLVVPRLSAFADLGAGTEQGFLDLGGLGLDGGAPLASPALADVCEILAAAGLHPLVGTVLTLATMTGTEPRATELAEAYPNALAEAMEGYGVAWAAAEHGLPWAEIRAISNVIGRRDRSTWDVPAAFVTLGAAVAALAGASGGAVQGGAGTAGGAVQGGAGTAGDAVHGQAGAGARR
jgi:futalosine hydrolase